MTNIKLNPRNGQGEYVYFDKKLYKNCFEIEQNFMRFDGFKGFIIRY